MKFNKNIAISLILLLIVGCSGSSSPATEEEDNTVLKYTIYPNTDQPPSLTFYWGNAKQTIVPPTVLSAGKYGVWEGGGGGGIYKTGMEPATEIEMGLSSSGDPVYTYAEGTVVYISDTEVSVRYGSKYVVKYMHLVNIPSSITLGQTVEKMILVGYTESLGGGGFWEIEMDYFKSDTETVAIPPVDLFDDASAVVFDNILTATGEDDWELPLTASTAEGWVSYVGAYEMWADPNKCGVNNTGDFKGLEAFLSEHNMSFVLE